MRDAMRYTTILAFVVGILGCGSNPKPRGDASTEEEVMSAPNWFARGNHLRETNKEDAIKAYTEAIRLEPSMEAAYFNRALTYSELGLDKEAVKDMDSLMTRRSELAKKLQGLFGVIVAANISMGTNAADSGNLDLALEKYNIALTYDPNSSDAHVGRGFVFSQKGRFEDAIAEFDRALESNPKSALAFHNRGQTNIARSEFDQAVADFTKAIELDPNEPSAYRERARAYESLGQLANAKKDRQEASRLGAKRKGSKHD
jgi:tetratricopeptide (TPR) repeat protein